MTPSWIRCTLAAAAIVLAVAGLPETALAHARLLRSDPPRRASLARPPKTLRLWFNEAPEPKFARVVVTNEKGEPVTQTPARVDAEDPKQLWLDLPSLPPGSYTVTFEVLSVDGHRVKQSFPFAVKERAAGK